MQLITDAERRISIEVTQSIKGSGNFDNLEKTISQIEKSSFVPPTERKALLTNGWENSVTQLLENGIIDSTEEQRLVAFQARFALTQDDLDKNGAFTNLTKSAAPRDVVNGIVPHRYTFIGSLPVNLQKGEQVVWAFAGAEYLEDKVRREYVGGSQALSFRVAKGVYWRTGAFKGHSVEHTESVHVDSGWLIVTNKNIYFTGQQKSVNPYGYFEGEGAGDRPHEGVT